jgi:DeoR/GlpR family transcriptional regulator of sugar metabolism
MHEYSILNIRCRQLQNEALDTIRRDLRELAQGGKLQRVGTILCSAFSSSISL